MFSLIIFLWRVHVDAGKHDGVVSEKWICMNLQGIAAGTRTAIMLLST